MGIPIEKTFVVGAAPAAVWAFLTDPKRVAGCLPGAAITEQLDAETWGGTMAVKVGPVSASYKGKVHFDRLDPAAREADISASAQETRGKGGADMRMKSRIVERSPGVSEVTVTSDVNVVGVLAQFGRGMIQDVSDQLFVTFTGAMRSALETAPPPASSSAPTVPAAPPVQSVLDAGALGRVAAGRAAARTFRRPRVWIAVILIALAVYYLLTQRSHP
jgi:carbon monoxide dehydrogenase subunit G